MATFEDIAGWREEVADYRASDEGKAFYSQFPFSGTNAVPIVSAELPIRLAELMLTHAEILAAVEATAGFEIVRTQFPDIGPHHPEWHKHPTDAYRTILDFVDWYAMKVQEPYWKTSWRGCALTLAEMVVQQKINSVRAPAAYKYVKENYGERFN